MAEIIRLFSIPLIHIKFKDHFKYNFPQFPKESNKPVGWVEDLYTTFPNVLYDDKFIDYRTITSLKNDLKKSINEVFYNLQIPTNWHFKNFWYNYYYLNQQQEKHVHITRCGHPLHYWSGIYYNKYPTPTKFHNPNKFNCLQIFDNAERSLIQDCYYDAYSPNIEEGSILLFPSYLEHSVPPTNDDEKMRLTFAFNMNLDIVNSNTNSYNM